MSIAITDDHRALAGTVSDFLVKHQARAAARALLEADDEPNASFYADAADLGWLGLHVPEELGGSGFGLEEVVVVVEELGRALAPGAFVPTLIASAVLVAAGTDDVQARLLPGLADGSTLGAVALGGDVERARRDAARLRRRRARRRAGRRHPRPRRRRRRRRRRQAAPASSIETPPNLDPTRRSGRVTLDGATGDVLPGARRALIDLARTILAAEAVGVARESTDLAAEYAKAAPAVRSPDRHVPGRQAPLRQHGRGDGAGHGGGVGRGPCRRRRWRPVLVRRRRRRGARRARRPTSAPTSACRCTAASASRGSTTATSTCAGPRRSAPCSTPTTRPWRRDRPHPPGVRRERTVDLPPEAEPIRDDVRAFVAELEGLDGRRQARPPDRRAATPCRTGRRRTVATPARSSSS